MDQAAEKTDRLVEEGSATASEESGKVGGTDEAQNKGMTLVGNRWCFSDPQSGVRLFYNPDNNSWEPEGGSAAEGSSSRQNVQLINDSWIHRDPGTGVVSRWDQDSNSWVVINNPNNRGANSEENGGDDDGGGTKEKEEDPLDEFMFQLKQEELEKKRLAGVRPTSTYIDPKGTALKLHGSIYEWDQLKKAWFPKIDDDFIAQYQSNYGVNVDQQDKDKQQTDTVSTADADTTSSSLAEDVRNTVQQELMTPEQKAELAKQQKKQKRHLAQVKQKQQGWFEMDETHNTSVYVSGLPLNITQEEFKEVMSKCGLVAMDAVSRQFKLKLYKNEDGSLKGDGLCCYIKRESVELALQILDGYVVKDRTISVQPAKFQMKGDFDPSKKKKKLTAKQKQKFKEHQDRLFDWRPEKLRGERPKSDSTVILKNVFSIEDFKDDASRLLDLEHELKAECSKYGEVKRVVVYDNNPDGVVAITFGSAEMADDCITMMNWRIFHKRQLQASNWDGKTKYKIAETEVEAKKRIEHWEQFLDSGDN